MQDRAFLRSVVERLRSAGADVVVFGGWGEELRGICLPRQHGDVDLLYRGDGFELVDQLVVRSLDYMEIVQKRFPHKRAFTYQGVMIELFLVSRDSLGWFTPFWGTLQYRWPLDVEGGDVEGLPVAGSDALRAYRRDHEALRGRAPSGLHKS